MANNPSYPLPLESFHVAAAKLVLARRHYEVSAEKVFDAADRCQDIVSKLPDRRRWRWLFKSNDDRKLEIAKSTLEEAKRVEKNAAKLYEACLKDVSSYNPSDPSLKAKCAVTGLVGYSFQVGFAHVLPSTCPRYYFQKFGIVEGDDDQHIMLLCGNIEAAYNERRLSFDMSDLGAFRMRIWDPSIRNWPVFDGSCQRIGDFDNVEFHFPEGQTPQTNVLSFHAECSYHRAVGIGWISSSVEPPALYGSPLTNDTLFCNMEAYQEMCQEDQAAIEPLHRLIARLSVTSNNVVKAQKRISL